jgi:chorismate synthase
MLLNNLAPELEITGFASQIGPYKLSEDDLTKLSTPDRFVARFPSKPLEKDVERLLTEAKNDGRSYGGTAEIWIDGVPKNLGQPVFHKLKADLASAFMGVGATSSFELGDGFSATQAEGSEYHVSNNISSRYGGIRGGISTGERIVLRAGFKPTASVLEVAKKGRHDPCIVPRAIPVLEAMTALVLADHLIWARGDR